MSETVLPDFMYQGRVFSPSQMSLSAEAQGVAGWLWRAYARSVFGVVRILSRDGRVFAGNGFVVHKMTKSLLVATDLSPFQKIADRLCQVVCVDGRSYRAQLLAVDQQAGLSIIKVDLEGEYSGALAQIKALSLVRSTSLTGLDVACLAADVFPATSNATDSLSSADVNLHSAFAHSLAIFSGSLRGIKVDKRVELISRLEASVDCSGSPLLNKQGRVIGLIRKNQGGLEKAVGVEHIRALVRAIEFTTIPDGKLLKVHSQVGDANAKSEGIGFTRERCELPLSVLGEELALLREDAQSRRLLNARIRVEIEKAVLI